MEEVKWYDDAGLLHDCPNPVFKSTENSSFFSAEEKILALISGRIGKVSFKHWFHQVFAEALYDGEAKLWRPCATSAITDHMSKDNAEGINLCIKLAGAEGYYPYASFRPKPELGWKRVFSYAVLYVVPIEPIAHACLKNGGNWLYRLILVGGSMSALDSKLDQVSGRIRWLVRFEALTYLHPEFETVKNDYLHALRKQYGIIRGMFNHYFKNAGHPIPLLAENIYDN
jgi:hypothetical protein